MRLTPVEEELLHHFRTYQMEIVEAVRNLHPELRQAPFDRSPAWRRLIPHWYRGSRSRDLKIGDIYYEFKLYRFTRTGFYGVVD